MERSVRSWTLPWLAVTLYPSLLLAFDSALEGHRQSGSAPLAFGALLLMLLASSAPPLALRALLITRNDTGLVLTRGLLFLMISTPSLFSLSYTLSRLAAIGKPVFIGLWTGTWLAIGALSYLRRGLAPPGEPARPVAWLRVTHGVAALLLLGAFLLPHLTNHSLAMWSVELHRTVIETLRAWYRSEWIEPVLLTLMGVMIVTGVPMVVRYSRQRLDAFRVVQLATGAYVAVFICSHVTAILNGRSRGIDTDWSFAAGPDSLLDGTPLLARLIPHYLFGTFCLIVHVACGLRIVLLQHGVPQALSNRAVYGVASVGAVVTIAITAALLGFHIKAPG